MNEFGPTHEDMRGHLTHIQGDVECIREWSIKEERFVQSVVKAWRELHEAIPMSYPDGTGILTPLQWVEHAKKQLGYAK